MTRRQRARNECDDIRAPFELALRFRWAGLRSEQRNRGMCEDWCSWLGAQGVLGFDAISSHIISEYVEYRRARGDTAGTIRSRVWLLRFVWEMALEADLPLVSKMFPKVRLPRDTGPRDKWWLTPCERERIVEEMRNGLNDSLLADYVEFICETGLRVEEALRLERRHFSGLGTERPYLVVPGTKTEGAARPIPLSTRAQEIALERLGLVADPRSPLFPVGYDRLKYLWSRSRKPLGLAGVRGATLKALRRSFAGTCHKRGMPTETLRRLLGHSRIQTTAEYLRLVGAYDMEEARRWLE